MTKKAKTISLVLGSGGARGLAHIGVIQVLEERGYAVQSISGSSMGALVGGMYAAGKLDVYAQWVSSLERLDVLRMLDVSFSGSAIFKGERIIQTLRDLIGDRLIEDLPVSFTAVATDIMEGREVWLSRGPLFDAIRASIAFPTIFSSVNSRGRRLVDGGLTNPIPIAPTLRDLTDLTIAVGLSGKPENLDDFKTAKHEPVRGHARYRKTVLEFIETLQRKGNGERRDETGFFDVISRSIEAMQGTIARLKLAAYTPDVFIEIPKNACTIYEFERARELIAIGRHKAEEALALKPSS